MPAGFEPAGIGNKRLDGSRDDGSNTGDSDQPPHVIVTLCLATIARSSFSICGFNASI